MGNRQSARVCPITGDSTSKVIRCIPPKPGQNQVMRVNRDQPVDIDRQWVRLRPVTRHSARMYTAVAIGLAWEFFALALAGPLLSGHSVGRVIAFILLVAIGLVPFVYAALKWLVVRNLEDARVMIDRRVLSIGDDFRVRVEQRARRGMLIKEMRLGLVCQELIRHQTPDGKHDTRTIPLLEKWETLTRHKTVEDAKRLAATREFTLPTEQPASSPPEQKVLPRIRWKLRLITAPAESPPYEAEFPIHVRPAVPATPWGVESDSVERSKSSSVM
jgi:hypothetical protein